MSVFLRTIIVFLLMLSNGVLMAEENPRIGISDDLKNNTQLRGENNTDNISLLKIISILDSRIENSKNKDIINSLKEIEKKQEKINDELHKQQLDTINKINEQKQVVYNYIFAAASILLALLGLIGFGGYKFIISVVSKRVEDNVVEVANVKMRMAQAAIYSHIGYFQYCESIQDGYEDQRKKFELNQSIRSTLEALDALRNTESKDKDIKNKLNKLRGQIKNNLAYYYAMRCESCDKHDAIILSKDAYQLSKAKDFGSWYSWQETYAFVLFKCGDSNQKADAIEIKERLMVDECIDDEWRKRIKEKWVKLEE